MERCRPDGIFRADVHATSKEDIKKKKFMTKKFVGSVVALLAVVGIGLGVKFGLP